MNRTVRKMLLGSVLFTLCHSSGLYAGEITLTEDTAVGLKYAYTEDMKEDGLQLHSIGFSALNSTAELDIFTETSLLGAVLVIHEDDYLLSNGKTALETYQEYYPDYEITEQTLDSFHYLFLNCESDIDQAAMDSEALSSLQKNLEHYRELIESVQLITPDAPAADLGQLDFETVNLDGETVTDAILAEKDITVINVWATYCSPCINEMPDLAAWEKQLPENVQLLYLCSDTIDLDSEQTAKAIEIADDTGVDRSKVLIWNIDSFTELDSYLSAVPTTFFVNREGIIIPQVIQGAYVEKYKTTLEDLLQ